MFITEDTMKTASNFFYAKIVDKVVGCAERSMLKEEGQGSLIKERSTKVEEEIHRYSKMLDW